MRCGVVRITVHGHPSKLLSKRPGTPLSGAYTYVHTQGREDTDVRVCVLTCAYMLPHTQHTHTEEYVCIYTNM